MRQSDSWKSSVKVGGTVEKSGQGSDTKIQSHSTLRWHA